MKTILYIILTFATTFNLFGQQTYSEADVIGKYYYKYPGFKEYGKIIVYIKKKGKFIEIDRGKFGEKKRYGEWKLIGDSIEITYFYEDFEGRTSYYFQFKVFKYKIDQYGICRTNVYMNQDIYYKHETCYKKKGRLGKKYPLKTITIIDNPGYLGPWRNEKKE